METEKERRKEDRRGRFPLILGDSTELALQCLEHCEPVLIPFCPDEGHVAVLVFRISVDGIIGAIPNSEAVFARLCAIDGLWFCNVPEAATVNWRYADRDYLRSATELN